MDLGLLRLLGIVGHGILRLLGIVCLRLLGIGILRLLGIVGLRLLGIVGHGILRLLGIVGLRLLGIVGHRILRLLGIVGHGILRLLRVVGLRLLRIEGHGILRLLAMGLSASGFSKFSGLWALSKDFADFGASSLGDGDFSGSGCPGGCRPSAWDPGTSRESEAGASSAASPPVAILLPSGSEGIAQQTSISSPFAKPS